MSDTSGLANDILGLVRLMDWAAGEGFCKIEGCADPEDMMFDLWGRYAPSGTSGGDYSADALAAMMSDAIIARVAEQDAEIARLREALGKANQIITDVDEYMKRPERGDYGAECALCMGELFDDDRTDIADIRTALEPRP